MNIAKTGANGATVAATLLVLLAGCSQSAPPAPDATPPPASSEAPKPADALPPPDSTPASPAQPAPQPPPPTDSSPTPKPTAAVTPDVKSMRVAVPGEKAKMTVAAELRYQFDAEPIANQPVTLHLATVGRVPGQKFTMTIKDDSGLSVAAGPVEVEKAGEGSVYRQQFSLTRHADGPHSVRVVVTMESPAGSAFGFYTIPLDATAVIAKRSAK
jgi:hypothetical protein